jgi:hypothetical protein
MAQAIFDQIARHGGWTDITCKNTGATAITKGYIVQGETGTSPIYPNVKNIAAADTVTCLAGVAVEDIAAGATGRVCVHGPAVVLANGAIAQFAFVQTLVTGGACDGKAITIDRTVTREAVPLLGRALTPSDGADDYIEVFVNIAPFTTAA